MPIQHEENWLGWIVVEQEKYKKKLCSQTFKASFEEVIVMYSEKMKAKCMKDDVWKSFFFFINLQFDISQLHNRLTPSQTVFWDFK